MTLKLGGPPGSSGDDDEDEDEERPSPPPRRELPVGKPVKRRSLPPEPAPRPRPGRPPVDRARLAEKLPALRSRERDARDKIADRFRSITGGKPRKPPTVSSAFGSPSKYEDDDED